MDFQEYVDVVLAFIREHEGWVAPLVFVLAFGESLAFISLILPFWGMLVAIGGLMGASSSTNFVTIWIAASMGAALGDWVSYWLGYRYHHEIGRMWPLARHPELLVKGHKFFERWGVWAIFLGRFLGPLRASVPIVAGIVKMPLLPFQVANFTSAFLWAFVLLSPGVFGLRWWLN